MAYSTNEKLSSAAGVGSQVSAFADTTIVGTFKQGTGTLAVLTPVAFDTSAAKWVPWTLGTNQITSLTMDDGVIAGDFTITAGGQTTAAIAFDATAAEIQTALEALSNIAPGDVSVTGGPINEAPVYIEFIGTYRSTAVVTTVNDTGIDPAEIVVATSQTAVPPANGNNTIKGLVFPNPVTLAASNEVLGSVMLEDKVRFSDIPVPSGISLTELETACKSGPRGLGIIMEGLVSVR